MAFAGGFMGAGTANAAMTDKPDGWLPGVPGAEIEGIFRNAAGAGSTKR